MSKTHTSLQNVEGEALWKCYGCDISRVSPEKGAENWKGVKRSKIWMSRCVPGERSGKNISDRGNRQRHKV